MELASGKMLDDELRWIKFSSPSWSRDNTGFFYGRFPEPTKGQEYQKLAFNQKIYWHTVGTPQSEDKLVYERPDHPDRGFPRRPATRTANTFVERLDRHRPP